MAHTSNLGDTLFAAGRFDAVASELRALRAALPDGAVAGRACARSEPAGSGTSRGSIDTSMDCATIFSWPTTAGSLPRGWRNCCTCCCSSMSSPRRAERIAERYDRTARVVYGPPRGLPPSRRAGPDPRRVPVGGSAQSRDGQDDLAGDSASRSHAASTCASIRCRERARRVDRKVREAPPRASASSPKSSERAAADAIAADDLDLLVDLSTHTSAVARASSRCKPARVQITHVASAGTVGLSSDGLQPHRSRTADVPGEPGRSRSEALLPMDGMRLSVSTCRAGRRAVRSRAARWALRRTPSSSARSSRR